MLRGGFMSKSRRQFLTRTSLGLVAAAVAPVIPAADVNMDSQQPTQPPPGAPPAFGTGPAVGPESLARNFRGSGKAGTGATDQRGTHGRRRKLACESSLSLRAPHRPAQVALEPNVAPWSRYVSALPGERVGPQRDQFVAAKSDPGPLPTNDADIAFAPVTRLSRWIEQRKLTSERLTQIYLRRIEQFDPKLRCISPSPAIWPCPKRKTPTGNRGRQVSRTPSRHPLGGKDLLDTAGIPTTYGAEPYRNRIQRRTPP